MQNVRALCTSKIKEYENVANTSLSNSKNKRRAAMAVISKYEKKAQANKITISVLYNFCQQKADTFYFLKLSFSCQVDVYIFFS